MKKNTIYKQKNYEKILRVAFFSPPLAVRSSINFSLMLLKWHNLIYVLNLSSFGVKISVLVSKFLRLKWVQLVARQVGHIRYHILRCTIDAV